MADVSISTYSGVPLQYSLNLTALTAVTTIPTATELEPGNTGKFSSCFWYRPENAAANLLPRLWEKGAQYMAIMGDDTNTEFRRVAIEVSNGIDATEFWARPIRLVDGIWYHIAGTFDQDTGIANIYLDGVAQTIHEIFPWADKDPKTMSTNPAKDFLIGNRDSAARPASGNIKDFLFYNRVITSEEILAIKALSYPSFGLITHHLLSSSSGTISEDLSGRGHDGAISQASWTPVSPVI